MRGRVRGDRGHRFGGSAWPRASRRTARRGATRPRGVGAGPVALHADPPPRPSASRREAPPAGRARRPRHRHRRVRRVRTRWRLRSLGPDRTALSAPLERRWADLALDPRDSLPPRLGPDACLLEAVIFDVDGTLVDSERDGHRVAFNAALRGGRPARPLGRHDVRAAAARRRRRQAAGVLVREDRQVAARRLAAGGDGCTAEDRDHAADWSRTDGCRPDPASTGSSTSSRPAASRSTWRPRARDPGSSHCSTRAFGRGSRRS